MYEFGTFWNFSVKKFGSWREIKGKEKNRGQSKDSAELIFYTQCSLVIGLILGVISLDFYYPWTAREKGQLKVS